MSRTNLAYKREPMTAEKYLELERAAKDKHEFIGGEIKAMAGASDNHNVIASNVFGELWSQLKGKNCRAFASDMRVKAKRGNYFYPDILVTCGEREFEDAKKKDVLLNPKVIFEVLSKSTKLKDRNEKFESYVLLESLTDYVLIEQDKMKIEHYSRLDEKDWKVRIYAEADETIFFESINCRLSVSDVYNEISL
ncbi:MAG: Uma2 family endonuclease [Pyrinomonadaceae bacterium]|nr:Uma2 family endonuclease [Pyrinomonadaceae bacterium]